MADLDDRLENVIKRRSELLARVQRIEGKKQAAEEHLRAAREACKAKKVDPDTIDQTIAKIEKMYEEKVDQLEKAVGEAESQLAPFLGEER